MGVERVEALYSGRVAYHDSCAGLREMGVKAQPRELLRGVTGVEMREMADPEVCCGFGGTFCVKYPDISTRMVSDKAHGHHGVGGGHAAGGRHGMSAEHGGRLSRLGSGIAVRHVAEVLADMTDAAPADRAAGREGWADADHVDTVQAEREGGAGRCRAAEGAGVQQAAIHGAADGGGGQPAGVRAAARHRARHQEPHAGKPGLLPRAVRRQRGKGRRARALGGRCGRGAADRAGHLPRRRRQDGDEGEVDDLRGVRDQRATWPGTGSRRSRRIWANTSSSCATRRRATSSRRRST